MVSIDCVAVGWLVWVVLVAVVVVGWLVCVVFAVGWQLVEGVFVWCGWCAWRLRCRFRIWCVMVAVGCRLSVALLVFWVACGFFVGW